MRIAKTNQIFSELKDFIEANWVSLKQQVLNENPANEITDIADYRFGFVDITTLQIHPTVLISLSASKPNSMFSDTYELEVVVVNKSADKTELIREGYLYSDMLYYLFRTNPSLGGIALNSVISKREHFEGDNFFISDFTLNVEIEEGRYI